MNYQNILVFMAVVEHGNFSAAAKALNYTPPGVAEAVKQLEKELDVSLLLRKKGSRNVIITPAGQAFLPKAKKMVQLEREILQFVRDQKKKRLRIAAGNIALSYIVPHVTQRLIQERPDIELQLYAKTTREIAAGIEPQLFDVAVCYGAVFDESVITQIPFYEEERVILCTADSVLPDRPLSPQELPAGHRIAYSKSQLTLPRDFMKWSQENRNGGVKIPSKIRVPNWLAIPGYLTEPEDWSIVPISIAELSMSSRPGKLSIRRLTPAPPLRRCTLLISKAYADRDTLQEFLRCCGEFVDSQPHLKNVLPPVEQVI